MADSPLRRPGAALGPARTPRSQLAVLLRTPRAATEYEEEWQSFVTVLDAHATEEERDLCPAPIDLSEDMLDTLGDRMVERIARLRQSTIHKLRVRGRAALLSSM